MSKRKKRFKRGWHRFFGWVKKIFGVVKDVDEYVKTRI